MFLIYYFFYLQECNYRLLDGGNEYIQLMNICCGIIKAYELV